MYVFNLQTIERKMLAIQDSQTQITTLHWMHSITGLRLLSSLIYSTVKKEKSVCLFRVISLCVWVAKKMMMMTCENRFCFFFFTTRYKLVLHTSEPNSHASSYYKTLLWEMNWPTCFTQTATHSHRHEPKAIKKKKKKSSTYVTHTRKLIYHQT